MPWNGILRCKKSTALKKNCKEIGIEKLASKTSRSYRFVRGLKRLMKRRLLLSLSQAPGSMVILDWPY